MHEGARSRSRRRLPEARLSLPERTTAVGGNPLAEIAKPDPFAERLEGREPTEIAPAPAPPRAGSEAVPGGPQRATARRRRARTAPSTSLDLGCPIRHARAGAFRVYGRRHAAGRDHARGCYLAAALWGPLPSPGEAGWAPRHDHSSP